MMLSTLPILLAALAPQAEVSQASVVRLYDVSSLLVGVDESLLSAAQAPPAVWHGDAWPGAHAEDSDRLESDVVLDMVFQLLEPEFEYADRELFLVGESLLVARLPEPLQADVAGLLEFLGDSLRRTHTVRLRRYLAPDGADALPTGTLGPEAWGALQSALGAPEHDLAVAVPVGGTRVLDLRESRQFLADYDIEIAGGSFAYDPVVVEALLGWSVAARVGGDATGGRVAIVAQYAEAPRPPRVRDAGFTGVVAVSEPRAPGQTTDPTPRRVETGANGALSIESLEVLQRALAFETHLPTGGGLALRLAADLPAGAVDELWTFELTGGGPRVESFASAATARTLVLVDPGSAAGLHFEVEGRTPLLRTRGDAPYRIHLYGSGPGQVHELLPGRTRDWNQVAGRLFRVDSEAGVADAARAALAPLWASRGPEAGASVVADGAARLDLPLAVGSRAIGWVGQYQWVVSDADVEVANNASARDAVVEVVGEGLYAEVSGRPAGDGWEVDLRAASQRRVRGLRTVDLADAHGGALELFDVASVAVETSVVVVGDSLVRPTGSATGGLGVRLLPAR